MHFDPSECDIVRECSALQRNAMKWSDIEHSALQCTGVGSVQCTVHWHEISSIFAPRSIWMCSAGKCGEVELQSGIFCTVAVHYSTLEFTTVQCTVHWRGISSIFAPRSVWMWYCMRVHYTAKQCNAVMYTALYCASCISLYCALCSTMCTGAGSALYLHLNPSATADFSYPHCSTLETTISHHSDDDDDDVIDALEDDNDDDQ